MVAGSCASIDLDILDARLGQVAGLELPTGSRGRRWCSANIRSKNAIAPSVNIATTISVRSSTLARRRRLFAERCFIPITIRNQSLTLCPMLIRLTLPNLTPKPHCFPKPIPSPPRDRRWPTSADRRSADTRGRRSPFSPSRRAFHLFLRCASGVISQIRTSMASGRPPISVMSQSSKICEPSK